VLENLTILTTKIMMYTAPIKEGGLGVLKGLAIDLFCLILSVYSFGGLNRIKGHNKLFFQLISTSVFITLLSYFGTAFTLFGRLNLYFTIPSILLLPNALANLKNKKIQYLLFIPVIFVIYLALLNAKAQYGFNLNFY
ncbi:EpsG family protein, partial [Flavobacteriaceae bacterium]|nr:EpsG family protein [Flavobacteriaceae bacterium]